MQQERSPSTPLTLPTDVSPVTSVLFNHSKKDEAKYMTDMNHLVDPIGGDCRNTIRSMSASATAAIQGRKRPAEIMNVLPHVGEKSTEDITASRSSLLTAESSLTINPSTVPQGG
eukprot:15324313-Ditylum_brightwellii.AAC.1